MCGYPPWVGIRSIFYPPPAIHTQKDHVSLAYPTNFVIEKNYSRARHTKFWETKVLKQYFILLGLQSVVIASPTPTQHSGDPIGGGTFYHPTPASRARNMPDVAKLPRTASKKLLPVNSRLTSGNFIRVLMVFLLLQFDWSSTPGEGGNITRRPRDFDF